MDWFFLHGHPRNTVAASNTMTRRILRRTGDYDNEQDAAACQGDALPHQNDSPRGLFCGAVASKKSGGHAGAQPKAHQSNHERLPAAPMPVSRQLVTGRLP